MPTNVTVVESLAWLLADEEEALAQGLHDEVYPSLAAIRMSLEAARHGAPTGTTLATVDASLGALEGWARAQQTRVRASLLKRMTLGDALLWYGARLEEGKGAAISVVDDALPLVHPFPVALTLLGHTQEQLNHHVRSPKNHASVRIWADQNAFHVAMTVAHAETSAPPQRFGRLVQAMGGTCVEHRSEAELSVVVSIPRA